MIYKITIKSAEGKTLYYTVNDYKVEGNLISFTDKFGEKQSWNTQFVINIAEQRREWEE